MKRYLSTHKYTHKGKNTRLKAKQPALSSSARWWTKSIVSQTHDYTKHQQAMWVPPNQELTTPVKWRIQRRLRGFAWTPPPPPFLNIIWKWNNLVSVRPNCFIFMGISKIEQKAKRAHIPLYIWTPFPEILDPPLQSNTLRTGRSSVREGLNIFFWQNLRHRLCYCSNVWIVLLAKSFRDGSRIPGKGNVY